MAIIERISVKALPIETNNRFAAAFNVPTPGQYDFGTPVVPIAANVQIAIPVLNPNYVYMIDRVSFSASIDEGVYLESIAVTPEIRLYLQNTTYPLYARGLPGVNYKDNLEWRYWFWTGKKNDALIVRLTGSLNQVAATVGVATIFANLSMVIYEENNLTIIKRIKANTCPDAGEFYSNG